MSENFDNQLLETKKKNFIEVVNRICGNRNLPLPYVNFDGCPAENRDQLAHYHSDVNMICISKRQLFVLNFEDLEEVAAHEVAHILEQNHDSNFRREENINKRIAWKPSGVVVIYGNQKVGLLSKEEIEKIEEALKRLQEQIEREKEEEIRREFPLAPPKRSDVIIIKDSSEDIDMGQISREVADEEEKKEIQEERTKWIKEELEAKLEGTTYNDIQNGNLTNIPKEELMPDDLSNDRVIEESKRTIKEANELRKLYSPKLKFRLLRGMKSIFRR